MWSDLLIGSGYAGRVRQGAGGLRAWGQDGKQGDVGRADVVVVVAVFVEYVFQKIPGRSTNAAGQKNMNKTKHWEPFAMPKVVVSLVRIRVLALFFLMTHCQVQMSRQTDSVDNQEEATPLGFMFPQFSWYWYTRLSLAVGYRAQNIARRPVGSLQRDIAVKIFHIVVTLVTSYGKPEWEQVVPIEWSVHASKVPWGP